MNKCGLLAQNGILSIHKKKLTINHRYWSDFLDMGSLRGFYCI